MKKIVFALITVLAVSFCMEWGESQKRSDVVVEGEVARRVQEIYNTVIPWYNSPNSYHSENDFDKRFLSREMQVMRRMADAVLRKLRERGEDDIPPCYDYDHWVMGQDWENLSIKTDSIHVLSPDTAEAYMCITNCGHPQNFMLVMTRDDKGWFIDDFRQYDEQAKAFAISDKRNLEDYIKEKFPAPSEVEKN